MRELAPPRNAGRGPQGEAPRDLTLTVCGRRVAVTTAGDGPPLVLLHGLGGTRATWRHLFAELARTRQVIAPDLAGHGGSQDAEGDFSLAAQANCLRDLLVALDAPRADVVGHSLGGGVAMQFAYQFPERVHRLGLIGSGGLGPELTVMLRAAVLPGSAAAVAALSRLPGWLIRRLIPGLSVMTGSVSRHDCAAVSEALLALRDSRHREAFLATARNVIGWRGQAVGAASQLSHFAKIPVLAIWGLDDRTIPPHHLRNLLRHAAHAELVEIPEAGHFPHETHPAHVAAAITSFLAEHDADQRSATPATVNSGERPCQSPFRPGLAVTPAQRLSPAGH